MKEKTPNDAVTPQRQSQFTPKMKANAVPRLLSSLVWIDQYNERNGITSFMEFMWRICYAQSSPHIVIWYICSCLGQCYYYLIQMYIFILANCRIWPDLNDIKSLICVQGCRKLLGAVRASRTKGMISLTKWSVISWNVTLLPAN